MIELPGFFRGDDHSIRLVFKKTDKTAMDIGGWKFICTIKLSSEMPDAEGIQATFTAPDNPIPSQKGIAVLQFSHDQTKTLLPTRYQVDVQKNVSGSLQTLFVGSLSIKADVTRGE